MKARWLRNSAHLHREILRKISKNTLNRKKTCAELLPRKMFFKFVRNYGSESTENRNCALFFMTYKLVRNDGF